MSYTTSYVFLLMCERLQISRTLSLEPSLAMCMCLKIFAALFLAHFTDLWRRLCSENTCYTAPKPYPDRQCGLVQGPSCALTTSVTPMPALSSKICSWRGDLVPLKQLGWPPPKDIRHRTSGIRYRMLTYDIVRHVWYIRCRIQYEPTLTCVMYIRYRRSI